MVFCFVLFWFFLYIFFVLLFFIFSLSAYQLRTSLQFLPPPLATSLLPLPSPLPPPHPPNNTMDPKTSSEPFQQSGFDWSLLKSTSKLVRTFPAHSTIVEADVTNHSLFWLEEGEVRFEYEDGSCFGGLTSKNDWPLFCELSGMGQGAGEGAGMGSDQQGRTLFRVVAETECRVRILSMDSIYSLLFGGGKKGEEVVGTRAISFFETLLRHYASTLYSFLTHSTTSSSSVANPPLYSGRGECCSSVFEEAVVFTWKCSFLRKGGEEGLVCLTASYLALIRNPSRKTKTIGSFFFIFIFYFILFFFFLRILLFFILFYYFSLSFLFSPFLFSPARLSSLSKVHPFLLFCLLCFCPFPALSPFSIFAFLFRYLRENHT